MRLRGIVKSLLNEWVFVTNKDKRTEWSDKPLINPEQIQETFKVSEKSLSLCKEGAEFEGTLEENKIVLTGKCTKIEFFNRSGIPLSNEYASMVENGDFGDFEKSITYTIKK